MRLPSTIQDAVYEFTQSRSRSAVGEMLSFLHECLQRNDSPSDWTADVTDDYCVYVILRYFCEGSAFCELLQGPHRKKALTALVAFVRHCQDGESLLFKNVVTMFHFKKGVKMEIYDEIKRTAVITHAQKEMNELLTSNSFSLKTDREGNFDELIQLLSETTDCEERTLIIKILSHLPLYLAERLSEKSLGIIVNIAAIPLGIIAFHGENLVWTDLKEAPCTMDRTTLEQKPCLTFIVSMIPSYIPKLLNIFTKYVMRNKESVRKENILSYVYHYLSVAVKEENCYEDQTTENMMDLIRNLHLIRSLLPKSIQDITSLCPKVMAQLRMNAQRKELLDEWLKTTSDEKNPKTLDEASNSVPFSFAINGLTVDRQDQVPAETASLKYMAVAPPTMSVSTFTLEFSKESSSETNVIDSSPSDCEQTSHNVQKDDPQECCKVTDSAVEAAEPLISQSQEKKECVLDLDMKPVKYSRINLFNPDVHLLRPEPEPLTLPSQKSTNNPHLKNIIDVKPPSQPLRHPLFQNSVGFLCHFKHDVSIPLSRIEDIMDVKVSNNHQVIFVSVKEENGQHAIHTFDLRTKAFIRSIPNYCSIHGMALEKNFNGQNDDALVLACEDNVVYKFEVSSFLTSGTNNPLWTKPISFSNSRYNMKEPLLCGVAVFHSEQPKDNCIFVSDTNNNCIHVLHSSNGKVSKNIGGVGAQKRDAILLKTPTMIDICYQLGSIAVCERFSKSVKYILEKEDQIITIRSVGKALKHPHSIVHDNGTGNILVTDIIDNTIHVYDPAGTCVKIFKNENLVQCPKTITMNEENGELIVGDIGSKHLVFFKH